MDSVRSPQTTSWVRRFIFALVPAIVLITTVTYALRFMEGQKLITTERKDDRVVYAPVDILTRDDTNFNIIGPYMLKSTFPIKKPGDTFRIMLTGASYAMGSPYVSQEYEDQGRGGISDWLDAELAMRYPKTNFEVINAAAGGQNATRVASVIDTLIETTPDLFVVATGNNEGYVPASPVNEVLHNWILYRALKKTLVPGKPAAERPLFSPQNPDTDKIIAQYKKAISRIIKTSQRHKIPLILSTLPINYRFYAFDPSLHGTVGMINTDEENIDKGKAAFQEKHYEKAIKHFLKANDQILATRMIAQCLEAMGNLEEARNLYRSFVELAPMNRMRPSFNEWLRTRADEKDVYIADIEKTLEGFYKSKMIPENLFHDYCHMTWMGYYLSASVITDVIIKNKLVNVVEQAPRKKPTVDSIMRAKGWQDFNNITTPKTIPWAKYKSDVFPRDN